MSTASEKANLARIRDNQRRSRARRKEYLQELEARLRQCELQGIEASSEIQIAARRVADENKKLRLLLGQNGVADDDIDAYVQSSPTSDTGMGGQYGSASSAVQALEQLLLTRKACCVGSPPANMGKGYGPGSRGSSVGTVQSSWDPNDQRRSGAVQQPSQGNHILTPTSTASRTSSVSIGHNSNHSMPHHHQRMAPVQVPQSRVSPSRNSNMFDFDPQFTQSYTQQPLNNNSRQQMQPRSSTYNTPTTSNVNSCVFAADMITTMAGGDPSAVRAQLGCLPDIDCEVDNHLVFNVMDRYTTGVGL